MNKNDFTNFILILGPPMSGKTHLIKYMITDLFKNKKLDYGLVFCKTSFNNSYNFLPEKYIHNDYNEEVIKNLLRIQIQQKENGNSKKAFIIFDDVLGSINLNSNFITELFTEYRHYNLTILFATQYLLKIPPLIRECQNNFICLGGNTDKTMKSVFENFMQDFKDYKTCREFILKYTKDYNYILVKKNEPLESKYTVNKAPKFKSKQIYF